MSHVSDIIVRPLLTEKSTLARYTGSLYTFEVSRNASKTEIAAAVTKAFGVQVEDVRTANFLGKVKRVRKGIGSRSDWKKAFVKLADGQTIDALEGV
ncbi:MAG TPA: 50S ribosomal protein L23 [Fibrobacteria bacterium]|nr:50S ribosomal protein L23 [Fibrobacteria bacterium]